MTTTAITPTQSTSIPWHAKTVLGLLKKLQSGQLLLTGPDNEQYLFQGTKAGIHAQIKVHDWHLCKLCLTKGDIGLAEAYIDGLWDSDDIDQLLRLFLANRHVIEKAIYGSLLGKTIARIKHWLNRNSKAGSRRNIHAHYDLGNSFYSLWLDPSMTYSSAWFESSDESLTQGQFNKYNKIISSIEVKSGDKILEIGCGWGGLMEQAILQGIHVDGLTISQEQFDYANKRISKIDDHHATGQPILRDYRDHFGQYDGIASIEMFEAVGEQYWDSYFKTVHDCLKPGKKACIQTIVIAAELFDKYRKSSDFIQQYVFPGGMLPSIDLFKKFATQHGLEVISVDYFGKDYRRTLIAWHQTFNRELPAIKKLGFDDRFIRLWNLYLMYCAAGFGDGSIDVAQITLRKSDGS